MRPPADESREAYWFVVRRSEILVVDGPDGPTIPVGMRPPLEEVEDRHTLGSLQGTATETPFGRLVATLHPAAVLRAPDTESRHAAFGRLVEDLRRADLMTKEPRKRRGERVDGRE